MKEIFRWIVIIFGTCVILLVLAVIGFRAYNGNETKESKLKRSDKSFQENKSIHQGFVEVYSKEGKLLHRYGKNMKEEDSYVLASITKLYTHALVYALVDQGKMDLKEKISSILPEEEWKGINIIAGKEYSDQITLQHLIDQNSGLADYETDKIQGQEVLMERLMKEDFPISPKDAIELTKNLEGKGEPGSSKAYYSNLNAILLGRAIEEKTGMALEEAMNHYIFKPLNLEKTKLISQDQEIIPFYVEEKTLDRPLYIQSSLAPGGLVSTGKENFIFLQAFFTGKLFNEKHLENPSFRSIQFFPLKYGAGMMEVELPFLLSPFIDCPEILGHSGSTGSFAFYCPQREIYIVGSMNQVKQQPFQVVYNYLDAFKK